MKFEELKLILKRLYKEYIVKHLKRIFLALALSILVAGSTSSIAWLLDPAVKKIFVEQDRTTFGHLSPEEAENYKKDFFNSLMDNLD